MKEGDVVCPGDKLASQREFQCGTGVYRDGDFVYSARCGRVSFKVVKDHDGKDARSVEVLNGREAPLVPSIGDVTMARVLRVTPRMCVTEILCIGSRRLPGSFNGVIKVQDVRATEIDKVVMHDCFRPGDLVRAEVLSLGTMRDYFLSTAKNELGVVWAKSMAGSPMVAVSWQEMRCPLTNQVEKRKVAKPN